MALFTVPDNKNITYLCYLHTKEELKNRIRMELYFWGSYEKIPEPIKEELDNTIKIIHNLALKKGFSEKINTEPASEGTCETAYSAL